MQNFDPIFKVLPQKKIWNALKKLFFAFLTSMLLLKESMSTNEAPFITKSYIKHHEEIQVKDTDRENAPSNKTSALTESMNMDIWVVGTTNQLFKRGSYAEIKFSKK